MTKPTPLLTLFLFFALVTSANAATISFATQAFGIDWTLTATDTIDSSYTTECAAVAGTCNVMFSVLAEIPNDLLLIKDEGATIDPQWITSAEAKIAGLQDYMLIDGPGDVDNWKDLAGPLANGCKDGNGGFACAQAKAPYAGAVIGPGAPQYTWTWVGNVSDTNAVFAQDGSGLQHLGAQLRKEGRTTGWNMSESGPPIPEPSAALVFAAGMLLASRTLRRRESR